MVCQHFLVTDMQYLLMISNYLWLSTTSSWSAHCCSVHTNQCTGRQCAFRYLIMCNLILYIKARSCQLLFCHGGMAFCLFCLICFSQVKPKQSIKKQKSDMTEPCKSILKENSAFLLQWPYYFQLWPSFLWIMTSQTSCFTLIKAEFVAFQIFFFSVGMRSKWNNFQIVTMMAEHLDMCIWCSHTLLIICVLYPQPTTYFSPPHNVQGLNTIWLCYFCLVISHDIMDCQIKCD